MWAAQRLFGFSAATRGHKMLSGGSVAAPRASTDTKSVEFAGDGDHVSIGQPADLEMTPNADPFTINAWFKSDTVSEQRFILAKAKMETVDVSYVLAVNNDGTVYFLCGGGENLSGGTITAGTWHQITLVCKNDSGFKGFLYLDGVLLGSTAVGSGQNTDVDWLIGSARWNDNVGDAYPFDGRVSDVSFWNGALTDAEVAQLRVGSKPRDPTTHPRASILLHWYRMGDGDTYPTITDRKGSANGTCVGMAGAGNIVTDAP